MLLENRIKEILATLVISVPFLEQKRIAAEEAERVRLEAERNRQREITRRKVERNRGRRILELSDRWHSANRLRSFIAALEATGATGDPLPGGRSHEEWLAWVRQCLARYDPLEAGADAIWADLEGVTSREYND